MFTPASKANKSLGLVYVGLLALAAAILYLVIRCGEAAYAQHGGTLLAARYSPVAETSLHLLLALIALLLASSLLNALCRWIHQPPVIGEILAGICLGPSLLGRLSPTAAHYLIPATLTPQLGALSQLGVLLFMFLVGLELDISVVKSHSRATLAISHSSIVVPFILGSILAVWLYPSLGTHTASFTVFALFLGVSMSVTAFPVLARILTDNGLSRSPMGIVALTSAAIDDVTAWCLLALIVGIAKANAWQALFTCATSLVYIAVLFWLVQPAIRKWVGAQERNSGFTRAAVTGVVLALLLSCLIAEEIGIHAIFGAFLLGALIPHNSGVAHALRAKFHDLVVVLLMPAFYVLTGMRTELALLAGWGEWLICGLIVVIACVGKFGGSYVAARVVGLQRRDAAAVGVLMNTRGLMELVVLTLGFDLGVISPTLFAMMVVMALVTTFLTSPLLRLLRVSSSVNAEAEPPPFVAEHGLATHAAAAPGVAQESPSG